MFYEPNKTEHGLSHNPFKSCIIPRPIGWISSVSVKGEVNLAPYSYFNAISDSPAMVMFSSVTHPDGSSKDTIANVEETKEFVVNMATYELAQEVNKTSATLKHGENEFEFAKLETAPSLLVKPPRVKKSPIHLECIYQQTIHLPITGGSRNRMVLGTVIGVHIDDEFITADGLVDVRKIRPIARLGYMQYGVIDTIFEMMRPK